MCEQLPKALEAAFASNRSTSTSDPLPLTVVPLSLDDLYLQHQGLVDVATLHPANKLLAGRGPAGTHEIALGLSTLASLATVNALNEAGEYGERVALPVFDKSLFSGQGDRSTQTIKVAGPVDIVLFEGWMLGFTALSPLTLSSIYSNASAHPAECREKNKQDYERTFFLDHGEEDLQAVNAFLAVGYGEMWGYLDAFVQLRPERMSYTWEWRLEVSVAYSLYPFLRCLTLNSNGSKSIR